MNSSSFLEASLIKYAKFMAIEWNLMDMKDSINNRKYCESFVNKSLLNLYLLIFSGSISISNKSIWASLRCFHSRKPPIPTGWGYRPGFAIGRWRSLFCVSLGLTVVAWQLLLVNGNYEVWKRYGLSISQRLRYVILKQKVGFSCPYVRYHSRIGIDSGLIGAFLSGCIFFQQWE